MYHVSQELRAWHLFLEQWRVQGIFGSSLGDFRGACKIPTWHHSHHPNPFDSLDFPIHWIFLHSRHCIVHLKFGTCSRFHPKAARQQVAIAFGADAMTLLADYSRYQPKHFRIAQFLHVSYAYSRIPKCLP